ncbi:MAG: Tim44-like domain-containing protein [Bacteroidetes bacterium]|nr:Tim44-like domain-containing protein [Bacteroidota bacterium]
MKKQQKTALISIIIISTILISNLCFARAGGGGGTGSGGGGILMVILAFILAPFFLVYSAILTVMLERKRNKVENLTVELNKRDKIWNFRSMMARVEEVFFKVQKAWSERDQELARDCMSDRIYQKHKMQTDEMIAKGTKNVLERINLKEVMIFSVSDYKDDSLDTFSARIEGSMIDYHKEELTGIIISGDIAQPDSFTEIWTFIRIGNKWVLDEIDQKVTMGDIRHGKIFTEK